MVNKTRMENCCEVCETNQFKYSCPRCSLKYCSVDCYKNHNEKICSESFYKEMVEEQIQLESHQKENVKQFNEILKKYDLDDAEDPVEALEDLDSDDNEDNDVDLADRISNINLNDTEALWNALTEEEKQEFKNFIQSDNVENLIEQVEPFWSPKKIQSLEKVGELEQKYEKIKNSIKPFDQITSKKPSELVSFNLRNVIASYTFIYRYFNGDIHEFFQEAVAIFVTICSNISRNVIFESEIAAIEGVVHECSSNELTVEKELLQEDVDSIFKGSEDPVFYLILALGDLKKLFKTSVASAKATQPPSSSSTSDKFSNTFSVQSQEIDRNTHKSYVKKIEYYLSFVQQHLKSSSSLK